MSTAPHPSRPVRVAVHDEGEGVLSLYLSEVEAPGLFRALRPHAERGLLASLGDDQNVPGTVPLDGGGWLASGRILQRIQAEPGEYIVVDEAVHPDELTDALPGSLLAAPEYALPRALGARVALTLAEDGHVVVLGRDPAVLASFLPPAVLALPAEQVARLLRPVADDAWHELVQGDRGLTLRTHSVEVVEPVSQKRVM